MVQPVPVAGEPRTSRSAPALIGALIALVAIVAVLGTILATRHPSSPSSASAPQGITQPAPAEVTPTDTPVPTTTETDVLPDESQSQLRQDIQSMLLSWHEDIVSGDFSDAWAMLSHRRQQLESQKRGYGGWIRNQKTLRPYLEPAGLHVTIQSEDQSTGVVRVFISGMRWTAPGARCRFWSGITWVKYEDGQWKYDPGYSTTPSRDRAWKHRFSQLLGGSC